MTRMSRCSTTGRVSAGAVGLFLAFLGLMATVAQAATLMLGSATISYGSGGSCSPGATCVYQGEASPDGTTVTFWGGAGPLINGQWGCCGPDFRGTGTVQGPIAAGTVLAFRFEFDAQFSGGTLTWRVAASGNLGGLSFSSNTGFQTTTEPGTIAGLMYYQVSNPIPGNGTFTLLIDLKYQAPTTSSLTVTVPRGGTLVWTNPTPLVGDTDGDCLITVADLGQILNYWGTFGPFGDVNYNGIVGVDDLSIVLAAWGGTCPAPAHAWEFTPPELMHIDTYDELRAFLRAIGMLPGGAGADSVESNSVPRR